MNKEADLFLHYDGVYKSDGYVDLHEQAFYYTYLKFYKNGEFRIIYEQNRVIFNQFIKTGKFQLIDNKLILQYPHGMKCEAEIQLDKIKLLIDPLDYGMFDGDVYTFLESSTVNFEAIN